MNARNLSRESMRHRWSIRSFVFLLMTVPLLSACAYNGAGSNAGDQGPEARSKARNQDRLTREEIMSVDARNLYDVVQRLRPRWITQDRRAGEKSFGLPTGVVVYQESSYLGDIDALRQVGPQVVYEVKWLDGSTASATLPGLGSQHVAGAIVIYFRPQG